MRYLIDTHVWIWMMDDPARLPKKICTVLKKEISPLAISMMSVWEIAKLVQKNRMDLNMPLERWIYNALDSDLICKVNLDERVLIESTTLPGEFHNDPADQIIVATARVHNLTLITADRKILDYRHVKTLWD